MDVAGKVRMSVELKKGKKVLLRLREEWKCLRGTCCANLGLHRPISLGPAALLLPAPRLACSERFQGSLRISTLCQVNIPSDSAVLRPLVTSSNKPGADFPVTVMQSAVIDPLLGNRLCTCEVTAVVLFSIYCPCLAQRDLEIYVCRVWSRLLYFRWRTAELSLKGYSLGK